jgi:hypothetical protein
MSILDGYRVDDVAAPPTIPPPRLLFEGKTFQKRKVSSPAPVTIL